jgi:probable rRNA maturation factor
MSLTLEWSSELKETIPGEWVDKLKIILDQAGKMEGIHAGEVALTFVDDEAIRELNRTYRGLDKVTDVLSFALAESGVDEPTIVFDSDDWEEIPDGDLLGDIVISVPRAKEQSEQYGHSLEREIGFLFVHGFLHLIGYDHQDEAAEQIMFAKQERILSEFGLTR